MEPALRGGERLLLLPLRRARPGDVVALLEPGSGLPVVKRVQSVGPQGVVVLGDNATASTDSRTYGPVAPGALLGRAAYRYHPPGRVGRIRRPAGASRPRN